MTTTRITALRTSLEATPAWNCGVEREELYRIADEALAGWEASQVLTVKLDECVARIFVALGLAVGATDSHGAARRAEHLVAEVARLTALAANHDADLTHILALQSETGDLTSELATEEAHSALLESEHARLTALLPRLEERAALAELLEWVPTYADRDDEVACEYIARLLAATESKS